MNIRKLSLLFATALTIAALSTAANASGIICDDISNCCGCTCPQR